MIRHYVLPSMIDDPDVREAIALYVHGTVTESEAARIAGISRAQLRYYARTFGVVAPPPTRTDGSEPSSSRG
jgi:hypothetical protein